MAPDEIALLGEALDTGHELELVLARAAELIEIVVGEVDRANWMADLDPYTSAVAIWQARVHVDALVDSIARIRGLDHRLGSVLRRAGDRTLRRTDGVVTELGDAYVRRLSVSLDRAFDITRTINADHGDVFARAQDFTASVREAGTSLRGLLRELDKNLHVGSLYAESLADSSRRMVEWAVSLLPVGNRARYREEFRAELYELRDSGKRRQIALALRLLVGTLALRRALTQGAEHSASEEHVR